MNGVDRFTLSLIPSGDTGKGDSPGRQTKFHECFGWKVVITNLTVIETYDCQSLWVYKERRYGLIVSDIFFYVDDGRPIGSKKVVL